MYIYIYVYTYIYRAYLFRFILGCDRSDRWYLGWSTRLQNHISIYSIYSWMMGPRSVEALTVFLNHVHQPDSILPATFNLTGKHQQRLAFLVWTKAFPGTIKVPPWQIFCSKWSPHDVSPVMLVYFIPINQYRYSLI